MTLKNLFGLALRQTTGLAESVLHLCGLAWPVPDFSTLCRRQLDLNVQVPYTRSQAGLHLLVDSTGIKFLGEGEWKCKKHGPYLGKCSGSFEYIAFCAYRGRDTNVPEFEDAAIKAAAAAKREVARPRVSRARAWDERDATKPATGFGDDVDHWQSAGRR